MPTVPKPPEADRRMERASTVDNPASHCITVHRRDGYALLPVNGQAVGARRLGHGTRVVPRQLA